MGRNGPIVLHLDVEVLLRVHEDLLGAFLVVGGSPAYCRDASAVSGFKFNAICDTTLGGLKPANAAAGHGTISGVDIYRRAGVRTLAPVTLDVTIQY